MKLRALAATAALAATGSVLVTAPALAGDQDGDPSPFHPYPGWKDGATATVTAVDNPTGRSTVTLTVAGLDAGRTYGAHAHRSPCDDLDATAAGPHWQRVPAPSKPLLSHPRYANPGNELWLDVTTDASGGGTSSGTQDFGKSSAGRPRSVIIHAQATGTGRDDAGVAGARLACIDVDL